MNVCRPSIFTRALCWLLALAILPEVFFCFYMLTKCPIEERTFFLGGGIVFGALALLLFWRLVVLGIGWLEYDDEKVVFHLSRDDEQTVSWDKLPSELVRVEKFLGIIGFTFLPGEEYDKKGFLNVGVGYTGYRDFKRECYRREVLLPPFKMSSKEQEAMAQVLADFFDDVERQVNNGEEQNEAEQKDFRFRAGKK